MLWHFLIIFVQNSFFLCVWLPLVWYGSVVVCTCQVKANFKDISAQLLPFLLSTKIHTLSSPPAARVLARNAIRRSYGMKSVRQLFYRVVSYHRWDPHLRNTHNSSCLILIWMIAVKSFYTHSYLIFFCRRFTKDENHTKECNFAPFIPWYVQYIFSRHAPRIKILSESVTRWIKFSGSTPPCKMYDKDGEAILIYSWCIKQNVGNPCQQS